MSYEHVTHHSAAVLLDPAAAPAASPTQPPSTAPAPPAIYGALVDVMASVGAVGKGSINKQQGYRYRGIDDVMTHVHAAMVKHRVVVRPTVLQRVAEQRPRKEGGVMYVTHLEIRYRWISAVDGSFDDIVVWGEGADTADKSTSKAQSMALKYGLLHSLMIPTEDIIDGDADHPDASGAPHHRHAAAPVVDAAWVSALLARITEATTTSTLAELWAAISPALESGRIDRSAADDIANRIRHRGDQIANRAPAPPAPTARSSAADAERAAQDSAAEQAPPPPPEPDTEPVVDRDRAARIAAQYAPQNGHDHA